MVLWFLVLPPHLMIIYMLIHQHDLIKCIYVFKEKYCMENQLRSYTIYGRIIAYIHVLEKVEGSHIRRYVPSMLTVQISQILSNIILLLFA